MSRLIRVFPRRTSYTPTDELAFVGDPPLFRPEADEVHVSCTYTWDVPEATRLFHAWSAYYPVVKIGGPAFASPVDDFIPGRYVKEGVTFTTRGCSRRCKYCLVPEREGTLREIEDFALGRIIQDNNLLLASRHHVERVFEMLRSQKQVEFRGGLDPRLITEEIAEGIRSTNPKRLYLAADTRGRLVDLQHAIERLQLPRHRVSVYTLIAFRRGESLSQAQQRLESVWAAGGLPFAQLYQPPDKYIDYAPEWRRLARVFSRPHLTNAYMKARAECLKDECPERRDARV